MRRRTIWLALALILTLIVIGGACSSAAEPAAPAGATLGRATPTSIARGGAMYDKWWVAADGASEPTGDHPLWSSQSSNTRSGSDTWRCKECHGWDYQGADGAYASGSHSTGFPGVLDAGNTRSAAELLAILKGGDNPNHDFSAVLNAAALGDLANFLSKGLLDEEPLIDYSTRQAVNPNLINGKSRYKLNCATCHGDDGLMIDFGDGEGVGALANDNPWEVLHKIRFGQPGSAMPVTNISGWTVKDQVAVLGYAQTLSD